MREKGSGMSGEEEEEEEEGEVTAHALMFGTPMMPATEEMLTTRGMRLRVAEWARRGKKACA
jgi:hypothetical protein